MNKVSSVPRLMPPTMNVPICRRHSAPAPLRCASGPRQAPSRRWTSGSGAVIRRSRNSRNTAAVTKPSCTVNRNSPRELTSEIMFSQERRPVTAAAGVAQRPGDAQMVVRADARFVGKRDRRTRRARFGTCVAVCAANNLRAFKTWGSTGGRLHRASPESAVPARQDVAELAVQKRTSDLQHVVGTHL